jgi:ATP-dependent DNA helicase PIF1
MKVPGSVLVEEVSETGHVRSSWRTSGVEILYADCRAEAQILLVKNKQPVRFNLLGAVSRVVASRWQDGMMTLICSRPRMHIMMSKMTVPLLQELAVFAAQFVPGAAPDAAVHAREVVRRAHKRAHDAVVAQENVSARSVAAMEAKRARPAASVFLTHMDTSSRTVPPLGAASAATRAGVNTPFGPPMPSGPPPSLLQASSSSAASQAKTLSPSANAMFKQPLSTAALAGAAAASRAPLDWRALLGFDVAEGLSARQQDVVELVAGGSNVYFTGAAGTGKSHLLQVLGSLLGSPAAAAAATAAAAASVRKAVSSLLGGMVGRAVATSAPMRRAFFTSTTGVTAVSIGGTTLQHWAGIGAAEREPGQSVAELTAQAVARVRRTPELEARWRRTDVLVIDEVSMLSAELFALLEAVARTVRGVPAPFGGIQLVVCGDFYQLPPVSRAGAGGGFGGGQQSEPLFAFESAAWGACFPPARTVLLDRVFRQKENTFADALNSIREGECDAVVLRTLQPAIDRGHRMALASNTAKGGEDDDSYATWLLTRKHEVEARNAQKLARLPGAAITIVAQDVGRTELLDKASPVRARISLKIGAQVLLMKNISVAEGLCNGTRGEVIRFTLRDEPIVYFASANKTLLVEPETWSVRLGATVVATRSQVPLELAWAVSVHKSQGMSLDQAVVSLSSVFEYGQAYVALSRVRSLEGLYLVGFDPSAVRAHPRVLDYYAMLRDAQEARHAGGDEAKDDTD